MCADETLRPKFSILLPTYNRADVLPFAIRSVLSQTIDDFELLIVGDGCTDKTADVVKGFADERIRWFDLPKTPNFGYANRNVALREARGELVAYMQHDDLWLPDHLEILGRRLEQHEVEIVYSLPVWVIPRGLIAPLVFNLNHPEILNSFLARARNGIPSVCVIHRRECFDKYGYWNADLPSCADWDMWARIIEGGERKNFAYVPEPTTLHFRANWRNETNHGPPQLAVWKILHDLHDFMPATLKLELLSDITEQEACWLRIEDDSQSWSAELRAAVQTSLEQRVSLSDERILSLLGNQGTQISPDKLLENYAFDYLLSDKVMDQQQQIESLLALVAERQREVDSLTTELADQRAKVLTLAEQVKETVAGIPDQTWLRVGRRTLSGSWVFIWPLSDTKKRVTSVFLVLSKPDKLRESHKKLATLTAQVAEREAELNEIRSTLGWRLLREYGKIKHRYFRPFYRLLNLNRRSKDEPA